MVSGMTLPRFDFEAPESIAGAAALLARAGAEGAVLGGGTDLLVRMKRGLARPRLVVSLRRIGGLAGVEWTADTGLRLGPLTTMARLAEVVHLTGARAALAEGAAAVGGPLVRNRATVGGNIVNARPCADTVPPLVVLGARLRLESAGATRTVDLDGFITGPGRCGILPGEILTAIELPPVAAGTGSAYLKVIRRAAMEVTIVGCAAFIELDATGRTVARARLSFTSVAATPVRTPVAEQALAGRVPDDAVLREAAALARGAVRPITDHRAPAAYRSEVVEVLARRALALARERAGWRAGR